MVYTISKKASTSLNFIITLNSAAEEAKLQALCITCVWDPFKCQQDQLKNIQNRATILIQRDYTHDASVS